ncbi:MULTISPECIES: TlpA disulfide reductase family protein [Niastella]|uniref:AhpC/TSA family protein n=1 Tax=Niastella soli TaxID=2821487 RepID=A0ABS3Z4H6_9BACT|nr:TlpA disulfide reductase family protein [Niastella soli]MBO9205067.1 AhpC/TSA family protein [Niastella soli]
MKKLIAAIFLIPVVAMAQKKGGFVITGTLTGLPDNAAVCLVDMNTPTDTLAKTKSAKGSFVLKGTIAEPNLYQLNFDVIGKKSVLFIGNDNVTIKGDVKNVQQFEVKGSPTNDDFNEFQKTFKPLFDKMSQLNQQLMGLQSAPNAIKSTSDSLQTAYKKAYDATVSAIDKFITEKKASPVAPFLLLVTRELEQDPAMLEKRYAQLTPAVQQGFYGKVVQQGIADSKVGAIGSDAIEFTQADTTGKPVSLNSFRGKYVLVDFWASWCKPCRMENPNVVTAYNKFKSKNFTVLGVSLDRSREPWIQAIKDDGLQWTQVSDLQFWNNEVARMYKIESIPQNYLIDPNGKIVGKNLRGQELDAKLCELLGCK